MDRKFGRLQVTIDGDYATLSTPETSITFQIEAQFFHDGEDWPDGFSIRPNSEGTYISDAPDNYIQLNSSEFDWLRTHLMRYRRGLLV